MRSCRFPRSPEVWVGPRWSVLLHPRDSLLCEDASVVLTRHHPAPGAGNLVLLELFWKVSDYFQMKGQKQKASPYIETFTFKKFWVSLTLFSSLLPRSPGGNMLRFVHFNFLVSLGCAQS